MLKEGNGIEYHPGQEKKQFSRQDIIHIEIPQSQLKHGIKLKCCTFMSTIMYYDAFSYAFIYSDK